MNDRFKFRVWWEREHRYRVDAKIHPIEKFFRKEFVIEQCTGLKDKNGKLIFEGDIIKDEFYRRFTIVWSEEDCMFEGRVIYRDPEYSDRYDLYEGATDDVEIIGNVHTRSEE